MVGMSRILSRRLYFLPRALSLLLLLVVVVHTEKRVLSVGYLVVFSSSLELTTPTLWLASLIVSSYYHNRGQVDEAGEADNPGS